MLALEIELLTGGYRATAFNDRSAAEWPVHPARVFSALVAALPDGEARDREEEDGALDALAALDPPEVWASEAHHRPVFEHYVPVNDLTSLSSIDAYLKKLGEAEREMATADGNKEQKKRARALEKAAQKLRQQSDKSTQSDGKFSKDGVTRAAQLIPGPQQSKQPRTFPVVTPHVALVHLVWGEADLSDHTFIRLQGIAARVARLGHSASLVRFRFSASPPTLGPRTRWRPNQKGVLTLRVPLLNQREALEREHERHKQEKARVLPYRPQRYQSMSQHASAPTAQGVFAADGWIV
ncbi:MAG: type I-U CRISPR-associated protein Csb2, partial [Myxococcota bacterium]